MATTKQKKQKVVKKQKRGYRKNLLERLEDGKPWRVIIEIENDIAKKIAEDVSKSPAGGEYKKLINNLLRKSYGMKLK